MGGDLYTNYREESLISRLESSRQSIWGRQLIDLANCVDKLAQLIAMKLVDNRLVETTNIRDIEEQLAVALEELLHAEDVVIQCAIASRRNLVPRPNRISLYITTFIVERLINHRSVIDVYSPDEEIYNVVNQEVSRFIR